MTRDIAYWVLATGMIVGGFAACSASDGGEDGLANESASSGYHNSVSATVGTGAGGGYGASASSGGPPSGAPVTGPPDEEDPIDVACDELDDSQPLTLYLSADDSNSMASPAIAREAIEQGYGFGHGVRIYEFLNYYNIDYPAPSYGELAIFPQALEEQPGELALQIGVRSFDAPEQRRPMTITLVLDTSGSMDGKPIQHEREVVLALAASLQEGDIVNAVTWAEDQQPVLAGHVASGPNDPTVVAVGENLVAGGGTDLHGGLKAGYALANEHYGEDRLNRVVLISDGGANVGVTSADLIAVHSQDADQEGIYLVGVGTGTAGGGYSDALMDVVTDEGRGAYVYIDSPAEAHRMFVDRFAETMDVAARGVQVELQLPWYFQMHKFYGEEYSENPEEVDPQHLAPSDAMIFNQVLKACDPQVVDYADEVTVTARWQEPLTYADKEVAVTASLEALLSGNIQQLLKGRAIVAYAEAVRDGSDEMVVRALERIDEVGEPTDPQLSEIRALLETHPAANN